MKIHLQSLNIPHFSSLMITMSESAYLPIVEYSPTKPVIISISSHRQCVAVDNGCLFLEYWGHQSSAPSGPPSVTEACGDAQTRYWISSWSSWQRSRLLSGCPSRKRSKQGWLCWRYGSLLFNTTTPTVLWMYHEQWEGYDVRARSICLTSANKDF